MNPTRTLAAGLIAFLAASGSLRAQALDAAEPVTIQQAVQTAMKNYPAIRAQLAEVAAASSGLELSKTAYLPRTDFHYQLNRATRNNIFGLMFPNDVIAPISGPASEGQIGTSTFGTAVGLVFRWEPFDFGLRRARVDVARKLIAEAEAGKMVTEYQVSLAAADAFFAALAADQAVQAAQANVERMEVFERTVSALVKAQLRPGADESRARAELARARNELIAARKVRRQSRLDLGRWMGRAGAEIAVVPGALLKPPPDGGAEPAAGVHPLTAAGAASIEVIRARRRAIAREYRPRFEILASVYGRGTGARLDGTFEGGAAGLYPTVGNWAVGLGVSFPLFDYRENKVRQEIEKRREAAEAARLETVEQQIESAIAKARVALDAARSVARNTPAELEAARLLERQARARYNAGLGTVVEVADAQRLLRQAETADALARLEIWRALFALAAAEGGIGRLLEEASR